MAGHNHYWGCTCGWCTGRNRKSDFDMSWIVNRSPSKKYTEIWKKGDNWIRTEIGDILEKDVISFTKKVECNICGEEIYLYRHPDGQYVLFEEIGRPWTKHVCK